MTFAGAIVGWPGSTCLSLVDRYRAMVIPAKRSRRNPASCGGRWIPDRLTSAGLMIFAGMTDSRG